MKLEDYFIISGTYELVDGLYNVNGSVKLNKRVERLPCKFGKVTGNFDCWDNDLITLDGCPRWVGLDLDCEFNDLITLEGCPEYIGCIFDIGGTNVLKSLEGLTPYIGGDFDCDEKFKNTKEYRQYLIMKELRQ